MDEVGSRGAGSCAHLGEAVYEIAAVSRNGVICAVRPKGAELLKGIPEGAIAPQDESQRDGRIEGTGEGLNRQGTQTINRKGIGERRKGNR